MKTIMLSLIIAVFVTAYVFSDKIETISDEYKLKVGTKYVLNKDTLLIIDYNFFTETFKLSNGTEINQILINQQTY